MITFISVAVVDKGVLIQGDLIMRWITKESDNYIFSYHAESIAGAFMEYLILIYGMERFKKFYSSLKEDNFEENFLEGFKISLSNANIKFIKYISSIGSNDTITNKIRNELVKRNLLKS